jgi:transcriptional regulator with XRE-family HTH domain
VYENVYAFVNNACTRDSYAGDVPYLTRARTVTWLLATERVERERILRGWTREQLALVAGVDAKTIRDMLNGRRQPTLGSVGAVARALERPLADLLVIVEAVSAVAPPHSRRSRSAAAAEAMLPLDLRPG